MIITGKKFSKPAMSRVINGDTVLAGEAEKPEKFRLDHILMEQHPEFNRSSLQKFVRAGYVTVNGAKVEKPNAQILKDDAVVLDLPAELANPAEKQAKVDALCPEVIYEDKNVLVVNKPAGLLSMSKGEICAEPTLEDYGLLVHRLDRDTSGVVILAKNPETQSMLRRQFQERKTHKTYYAVVEGRPKLDEALIDLPIARNLKRPNTFVVQAGGKEAQTQYEVVKSNERYSLLRLRPISGRTHQLRVHLKYLGHPIVGDVVYGEPDKRLYLHAAELEISIPNPEGGDNLRKIFSVPVPGEFEDVLR